MPREHSRIAMTPEELHDFLRSDQRLVLATADPDGGTWGDVVAFVAVDDRVCFKVAASSASRRNIDLDDRVCCVVERLPTNGSYYDICGAIMHGRVEAIAADDPIAKQLADVPDPIATSDESSVCFSIGLDDCASFMFSKIQYRYEDRTVGATTT
jgi:hypothetical protein